MLNRWSSWTVHAIIAPGLCTDIILGLPFLAANHIIVDHRHHTCISLPSGFDLLNPSKPPTTNTFIPVASICKINSQLNCSVSRELPFFTLPPDETAFTTQTDHAHNRLCNSDVIAALRTNIERLAFLERLKKLNDKIKVSYADVFTPIPHADTLPTDMTCKIKLKNTDKIPRWVNDFRQLNANMVSDKYPLPHINDILADAGHGQIWSKLDMTDSFFHTHMHTESIPYTMVQTPFGLYEWLVMPQGMKNAPAIHQHCVNHAL